MANHLHLLLQPQQGRDLPRIMQWFGWYSAMALNRLTGRCGHFWEARYFSTPIDPADRRRVLGHPALHPRQPQGRRYAQGIP
jgi:REP element-mobilizing transposase RayT